VLEANVDSIARKGLADDLGSDQCDQITKRYQLFGMMKSVVNMALLDADTETFERQSLSFSGLSQIMEQFMVWTAGCAEMPVTELWGRSASGMDATGAGDKDSYYDKIKAKQEGKMRLELEKIDQVLIRSALGEYPEDLEFEWNPLYQASGMDQAQQDLADANTDAVNLENGTIKPSMAMQRLQGRGTYAITDEQIAAQIKIEKEQENGEFDADGGDLPALSVGDIDEDQLGATGEESGQAGPESQDPTKLQG
jgi:hypothetical protein